MVERLVVLVLDEAPVYVATAAVCWLNLEIDAHSDGNRSSKFEKALNLLAEERRGVPREQEC